jgi:hypothetical protein
MKNSVLYLLPILGLAAAVVVAVSSAGVEARGIGNPLPQPVVYVTEQEMYYDSVITTPLPPRGKFQLLELGAGPHGGPQTEFGPGDPGYLGGRWWVDDNPANGLMDDTDTYFSCPLLGPGRDEP